MISALRKFTSTSQTFWGCDNTDTGGVLGVRVDGVDYTGDTLVSGSDYTGTVTATGLSAGTEVYPIDWPSTADVSGATKQKRRANYGKLLRYPNGNYYDSNPHTEYQLKETFTGQIKFRFRLRDGERTPRLYTQATVGNTGSI